MAVILYACFFLLFVTTLFFFHNHILCTSKTTVEQLRKESGLATGSYRSNPYMYPGRCRNIYRTLCCRRLAYRSKLTWEFYNYSISNKEALELFYQARDKAQKRQGMKEPFTKVFEMEQSVSIYKPSSTKGSVQKAESDPSMNKKR